MVAGRPPAGHNPKNYTFSLWEENKIELDKLKGKNKSEIINEALEIYFKAFSGFNINKLLEIEKNNKIIQHHEKLNIVLREELGKEVTREQLREQEQERFLKDRYTRLIDVIRDSFSPISYVTNERLHNDILNKFLIDVNQEIVDKIKQQSFSFEEYKKIMEENKK